MQWKVALLLCVAAVSGLMSIFHMYLLPGSRNSITVALEIPLQHSTSLELNIQSVKYPEKVQETSQHKTNKTVRYGRSDGLYRHSGNNLEMMKDNVLLSSLDEDLPELGEDVDNYVVLLDTGDYELKERDMDRPSDDPVPPSPHTHRHTKRRQHSVITRQPTTATTRQPTTATTTPSSGHQQKNEEPRTSYNEELGHQNSTSESKIINSQSERREKAVNGAFSMTKDEYYAKLASASSAPPPITHVPPHHPHTITSHTAVAECTHPPCLQYLSSTEKYVFNKCQKRTIPNKSSRGFPTCQCRFRDGAGKKRVALVSLPGSGNTWVRGLLEKATGVCTGQAISLS